MAVFNAFYFDGVSSLDRGLRIERKSIHNAPAPIFTQYQIPGLDGTVYQFEGFDNARVSYETFLKVAEPWDFPQWTGAVKAWLLGKPGQYLRLEDDYDLDHYRLAAYTSGLDWTQDWKRFARATIEFSCKPYRYLKSGEEQVSAQAGESLTLYNPTAFPALPELSIFLGAGFGGGNITLSVQYEGGSYSQVLSGVPSSQAGAILTLDCERQTVSNRSGLLPSAELAEFPALQPGENSVSVTGSGLSGFGVTPHWREL